MLRKREVRFTEIADEEVEELLAYLRQVSASGAVNVQRRLQQVIQNVAERPGIGVGVGPPGLRRIAVTPYPYFVFYEHSASEIVVIAVRHAARDPGTMPGGDDR